MPRYRQEHHPRHNVNLWILPLKMSLAAIGIFALTFTLDMLAAYHYIAFPAWFTMGGIDDARAILSAMLGCVSTVLALIFSVALLVLSMVANLFGPRLLYRFVQDWVTQVCIGLFMGAFIYVFLCFLVTHSDQHSTFIPQLSLILSWFIVLGAFSFLVFYSHRVAALIQNPDAIGRIVDDIRDVARIDAQPCAPKTAVEADDLRRLAEHPADSIAIPSQISGYVQHIRHTPIVHAAAAAGALVVIPFRPGQFVLEGEPLATISPASAAPALAAELRRHIELGRHRVLEQDVEFGLAQIVEIGIRALSPAINDTFTGIACVDLLGESLTILVHAPQRNGRCYDSNSTLRVQIRPVFIPRLIEQAFNQIRQAAAGNPAVLIRLLGTLARLASIMTHPEHRAALREQAAAVWDTANSQPLVPHDLTDIEAAWHTAQSALAEGT